MVQHNRSVLVSKHANICQQIIEGQAFSAIILQIIVYAYIIIYILYVYIIMYIYRHGCLFEHRVPHSIHHLMAISISHPPNIQHTPETIVDVGNQIISLEL